MEIKSIIHQYNNKDSLYKNALTNHLNMGLYALYKLGAMEEELHSFAKEYSARNELEPLPPIKYSINKSNFEDYLGVSGTYSSFISFFAKYINGFGVEETLKTYINLFIKGSSGGAFHGLIRLAYALELSDREEIVKALSYMAECYKEFPSKYPMPMTGDPLKLIENLSQKSIFKSMEIEGALIIDRMETVYNHDGFHKCVTSLGPEYRNFKSLSKLIAKLYDLTEDFTILHGVTSTQALWILEKYIDDVEEAINIHWYHLQLAYLSTSCVSLRESKTSNNDIAVTNTAPNWKDIFSKIRQSDNVHVIKLTYTLNKLYNDIDPDPLYLSIASNLTLK